MYTLDTSTIKEFVKMISVLDGNRRNKLWANILYLQLEQREEQQLQKELTAKRETLNKLNMDTILKERVYKSFSESMDVGAKIRQIADSGNKELMASLIIKMNELTNGEFCTEDEISISLKQKKLSVEEFIEKSLPGVNLQQASHYAAYGNVKQKIRARLHIEGLPLDGKVVILEQTYDNTSRWRLAEWDDGVDPYVMESYFQVSKKQYRDTGLFEFSLESFSKGWTEYASKFPEECALTFPDNLIEIMEFLIKACDADIPAPESEERFKRLMVKLMDSNRSCDIKRASIDKDFCNKLYKEFGL